MTRNAFSATTARIRQIAIALFAVLLLAASTALGAQIFVVDPMSPSRSLSSRPSHSSVIASPVRARPPASPSLARPAASSRSWSGSSSWYAPANGS
jgi:hypothetical protein